MARYLSRYMYVLILIGGFGLISSSAMAADVQIAPAPVAKTTTQSSTVPVSNTTNTTTTANGTVIEDVSTPVPEEYYSVEVSKGKLLRLPSPASAVIAADPAVADVQVISPTLVYINAKAVGETTIFAVDAKDREIVHVILSVENNLSRLRQTIKTMVPGSNVNFRSIDGALVMSGDVNSPNDADDVKRLTTPFIKGNQTLVNMLHSHGSNQVMLKVKIAEVNRTQLKQFGINIQSLANAQGTVFGLLTGRAASTVNNIQTQNGSQGALFVNYNNVTGVIDALEDNGIVTTLSEPTLTTQSGQAASFLAGGQIPVPAVTGTGTAATVSVTYQPYGVGLNFTPIVLSKDRINLSVSSTVSSLDKADAVTENGFVVPALLTRQTSTTVELGSGQSFAIAGLLENDRNNDVTKFPFLGDLPILGTLFRSTQFQHNQTELVIIVTPFIVKPLDEQKDVQDPTQRIVMPTDIERILLGKLYKTDEDAVNDSTAHLHGPVGYVLK